MNEGIFTMLNACTVEDSGVLLCTERNHKESMEMFLGVLTAHFNDFSSKPIGFISFRFVSIMISFHGLHVIYLVLLISFIRI